MKQAVDNLPDLEHHKVWLLDHLAGNAKMYLDMLSKLKSLDPASDEYATLEGKLYAQTVQVGLDANDVVATMDEITDRLTDDDT
jgi:hypothetical protein